MLQQSVCWVHNSCVELLQPSITGDHVTWPPTNLLNSVNLLKLFLVHVLLFVMFIIIFCITHSTCCSLFYSICLFLSQNHKYTYHLENLTKISPMVAPSPYLKSITVTSIRALDHTIVQIPFFLFLSFFVFIAKILIIFFALLLDLLRLRLT